MSGTLTGAAVKTIESLNCFEDLKTKLILQQQQQQQLEQQPENSPLLASSQSNNFNNLTPRTTNGFLKSKFSSSATSSAASTPAITNNRRKLSPLDTNVPQSHLNSQQQISPLIATAAQNKRQTFLKPSSNLINKKNAARNHSTTSVTTPMKLKQVTPPARQQMTPNMKQILDATCKLSISTPSPISHSTRNIDSTFFSPSFGATTTRKGKKKVLVQSKPADMTTPEYLIYERLKNCGVGDQENQSPLKQYLVQDDDDEFLIRHLSGLNLKESPRIVGQQTPLRTIAKRLASRKSPQRKSLNILNTPSKWKKSKNDRFIPDRWSMDLQTTQHNLSLAMKSADDTTGSLPTCTFNSLDAFEQSTFHENESEALQYQYDVARACGLSLDKRILAFNACDQQQQQLKQQQQHSRLNRPIRSGSNLTKAKRKIPTAPERILDAPGIADDFYLNLLDWSTTNNILAVGLGSSVYLWNAESGNVSELCSLGEEEAVASVSWSQDGSYVAVGGFDGRTQLWDVDRESRMRTINDSDQRVRSSGGAGANELVPSRVGSTSWNAEILSTGLQNGAICNHDVRVAQSRTGILSGHSGDICGLKWSGCGQQLASGGNDNLVNVWDIRRSLRPRFSRDDHRGAVKALAWCPWQSNLLASGGGLDDGRIMFWNSQSGDRTAVIDTGAQITSLVWSKFYREILSSHGFSNNQLMIWKYPTLKKVIEIPAAHQSRILHSAISPDGQIVCTGAADENLKFWRLFAMDPKHMKVKASGAQQRSQGNSGISPDLGGLSIR